MPELLNLYDKIKLTLLKKIKDKPGKICKEQEISRDSKPVKEQIEFGEPEDKTAKIKNSHLITAHREMKIYKESGI